MRRRRAEGPHPSSASSARGSSSQFSQLTAQFARRAEKRILHGLFRGAQRIADGPQLQSLVMLHFKNNALAWRKQFHRRGYARLDFFSEEPPLRIERGTVLALAFEEIAEAFVVIRGVELGCWVFRPRLAAAQLVQAYVGDDAIEPGIEAALEAETMQVAVHLEERLLINVAGVFRTLHQVHAQAKHAAAV